MEHDMSKINVLLAHYKKPFLLVSLVLLTTFFVGIGTIEFLTYQSGVFAKDKVGALQKGAIETVSKVSAEQGGVVEDFLMNVASGWVQQNLAAAETARFRAGLSCFDALGGPSPKNIINHVKTQVGDAQMLAMLEELEASLDKSEPQANGTASCASWILSG